jgi:hypothetical protein
VYGSNNNNNDYTFPVRRLGVFRDDLMGHMDLMGSDGRNEIPCSLERRSSENYVSGVFQY